MIADRTPLQCSMYSFFLLYVLSEDGRLFYSLGLDPLYILFSASPILRCHRRK